MVDLIDRVAKNICLICMEDNHSFCTSMNKCYEYELIQDVIEDSIKEWLSSFDSSSATECFTAVNLLKQRLEGEDG